MQCIFADEAGCLAFSRKQNVSRYFILCTVITEDYSIGHELLDLRRSLARKGLHADADQFHASEDPEAVRAEVTAFLSTKKVRVDATLFEKSKALPRIRESEEQFYRYVWYLHFKYVARYTLRPGEDVAIHAASIGTRKKRAGFRAALNDVVQQTLGTEPIALTFWPSVSDPCLQIADYYAWVIQRRIERGDSRHYDLLSRNIRSMYDIFAKSSVHHY